jgi:hypothetical protein
MAVKSPPDSATMKVVAAALWAKSSSSAAHPLRG